MAAAFWDKVDPRAIIVGHWRTLADDRTSRHSVNDVLLFYAAPAVVAAALWVLKIPLSDNALNIVTNALAILAGLLFNLLVLLQSLSLPAADHPLQKAGRRLAEEIYSNIAYSIIVSLVALIPLIVAANFDVHDKGRLIAGSIATYIVIHFALTMGMVLKRMHVMLEDEIAHK